MERQADNLFSETSKLSEDISWLLTEKRHPYYIVTPRYVQTSAGIRVLHLLCHALNKLGERAYIIMDPVIPRTAELSGSSGGCMMLVLNES